MLPNPDNRLPILDNSYPFLKNSKRVRFRAQSMSLFGIFLSFSPDCIEAKNPTSHWTCRVCLLFGCSWLCLPAEREGFEPPEPRSSTVFKTAAIDHSAISPIPLLMDISSKAMQMYVFFLFLQTILPTFIYVFHNKLCINIYWLRILKNLFETLLHIIVLIHQT